LIKHWKCVHVYVWHVCDPLKQHFCWSWWELELLVGSSDFVNLDRSWAISVNRIKFSLQHWVHHHLHCSLLLLSNLIVCQIRHICLLLHCLRSHWVHSHSTSHITTLHWVTIHF
jgi:hypothetical protein